MESVKDLTEKELKSKKEVTAGVYARVSTEEQKTKGISIETQLDSGRQFVASKGGKVYKEYVDAGFSGGNIKRPAFQNMLSDLRQGNINLIVFTRIDRFSRNVKDIVNCMDEIRNYGNVASIHEALDTTTAQGRFILGIFSYLAQLEREKIKERIEDVFAYKFSKGFHVSKTPFGYKFSKKEGNIIPHPIDSARIPEIFTKTISDVSYKDICSSITIYKKSQKKYINLPIKSYYNILRNKVYCGYVTYNGVEKKGCHIPLIDENMFILAQQKIKIQGIKKKKVVKNV